MHFFKSHLVNVILVIAFIAASNSLFASSHHAAFNSGTFEVDPSGAANYAVKLAVPPGTSGMQPLLSVKYASDGNNGIMGVGWGVTGISLIHRCGATKEIDGYKGEINLDVKDRYCLSGQRLIAINGVEGADGTEYRLQQDNQTKVISHGKAGEGPAYFEVQTKSGQNITYGNDNSAYCATIGVDGNSRIEAQEKPDVLVWAVGRVEDTVGNYIEHCYHEDNTAGEFRIEKIAYTGNNNQGLLPNSYVNFLYEDRSDNASLSISGSTIKFSKRLNQINTLINSEIVKSYKFKYRYSTDYDVSSLLESLSECSGDNICKKATSFSWKDSVGRYEYRALNENWMNKELPGFKRKIDINNDGKEDIYLGYDFTNNVANFWISNDAQFTEQQYGFSGCTALAACITDQDVVIFADVNGDGLPDMVANYNDWIAEGPGMYVGLNTGAGFSEPKRYQSETLTGSEQVGDIDGDGVDEIYILSNSTSHYFWKVVNGEFSKHIIPAHAPDDLWVLSGGASVSEPLFADYNGDGKADLVANYDSWESSSKGAYVRISNGDGFDAPKLVNSNYVNKGVQIGDINGDKALDFYWGYDGNLIFWVSGNEKLQKVLVPYEGYHEIKSLADIDGDGVSEFIITFNGDVNRYTSIARAYTPAPNVITTISSGLGETKNVIYKPINDPSVYTKYNDAVFPLVDVKEKGPIYVVSSYSLDNGLLKSDGTIDQYVFDYHYEGAKEDTERYGFLGFRKITITDSRSGHVEESVYSQDYINHFQGQLEERTVKTASGTVLEYSSSSSKISYPFQSTYNNKIIYRVEEDSTIDKSYNSNGELISTVNTSYEYDVFGNNTKIIIVSSDGFTKVTSNVYDNNENSWILGRLISASVVNTTSYNETGARTSAFEYDPVTGLLVKEIIEPENPDYIKTTAYSYDGFGNRINVSVSGAGLDASINSKTVYDARGQFPVSETNALGQSEAYTYDPRWGVKTSLIGPNGLTTQWEYDSLGRQIKELRADKTSTSISYNLCEEGYKCLYKSPIWITTESTGSAPNTLYLDPLGREVRTETLGFDGRKIIKLTEYHANGQVSRVSQPHFEGGDVYWTGYIYDDLGRLKKEINPDDSFTEVTYDGLTTITTNDMGQKSTEIKNSQGQIIQVTNALGNSSHYVHDALGNLKSTVDPMGNETKIYYDILGRKIAMDDPDMGYWEYKYNALDQLVWQKDAKDQIIEIFYDKLGRIIKRVEAEGASTWEYDTAANGIGKLHKSNSASNVSTISSYDALGRPIKTSVVLDGYSFDTQLSYDGLSRVKNKTNPGGFATTNIYNVYGYLSEVKNAANDALYWQLNSVNAEGQTIDETLGNGIKTLKKYNDLTSRLEGIITGNGGTVQMLSYQFDTLGNLKNRTDDNQGISEVLEFDQVNRLVKSTVGAAITSFEYDSLGNITSKSDVGSYSYDGDSPHAVSKAGGAVYTYDLNGNMISGDGRTLSYTSFNKPASIQNAAVHNIYQYDATHGRIKKTAVKNGATTTTYYLGKGYEKVINPSGVEEHKNYINTGGSTVLYTERSNGTKDTRYLHKDHLGTTDAITGDSGVVLERSSFDAWGARRNIDWSNTSNFGLDITSQTIRGFTGHEQEAGIGLINMNARMYDAKLGRFLSPDSFVQFPYSTQGLNRYTYVNNNPVSYTDPSGHFLRKLFRKAVRAFKKAHNIKLHIKWLRKYEPGTAAIHSKYVKRIFIKYQWARVVGQVVAGFFGGPAGAAGFSAYLTEIQGGTLKDALRAGITTYVTGAAFNGLHDWNVSGGFSGDPLGAIGKTAAHGAVGGISSELQGGSFKTGFMSAAFTQGASLSGVFDGLGKGVTLSSKAANTVAAGVVGGTASVLGGGKFANGAATGAFSRLFNDLYYSARTGKVLGRLLSRSETARGLYNQLNNSDWKWRIEEDLNFPFAAGTRPEYTGELGIDDGWGYGVIKINPNIRGEITTVSGETLAVSSERVLAHELAHAVARSNLGRKHRMNPASNDSVIPIENKMARELDASAPLRMLDDPLHN